MMIINKLLIVWITLLLLLVNGCSQSKAIEPPTISKEKIIDLTVVVDHLTIPNNENRRDWIKFIELPNSGKYLFDITSDEKIDFAVTTYKDWLLFVSSDDSNWKNAQFFDIVGCSGRDILKINSECNISFQTDSELGFWLINSGNKKATINVVVYKINP